MDIKIEHYKFVEHIMHDICVNFYCRGARDAGMDESEALNMFTSKFALPYIDDPNEVLEVYMKLKKMLHNT